MLRSLTVVAALVAVCFVMTGASAISPTDVPKQPPKGWWADPCKDYKAPAEGIGRKVANVVVVNYNPTIEAEGGRKLTEVWKWSDPRELTRGVIEGIRKASGGYINYRIVKWVDIDGCPPFRSGFRYDDAGIMDVLHTHKWIQGDGSSYAKILEEAGVTKAFVEAFNVTEVWLWGAPGFHWDEYAMFIPNRAKRLPPTDNPWFYRPYDIPDLGRTIWVMGWNYERGLGEALHSYAHRVEGMLALVLGGGKWDKKLAGKDPWNTWSMCDMDFPGEGSCGNVHVPPNGQNGYDYGNKRTAKTYAEDWVNWPNVTGKQVTVDGTEWDRDQAQYMVWWMGHMPKNPGRTAWGWNNWWIYVANFDCTLDEYVPPTEKEE